MSDIQRVLHTCFLLLRALSVALLMYLCAFSMTMTGELTATPLSPSHLDASRQSHIIKAPSLAPAHRQTCVFPGHATGCEAVAVTDLCFVILCQNPIWIPVCNLAPVQHHLQHLHTVYKLDMKPSLCCICWLPPSVCFQLVCSSAGSHLYRSIIKCGTWSRGNRAYEQTQSVYV